MAKVPVSVCGVDGFILHASQAFCALAGHAQLSGCSYEMLGARPSLASVLGELQNGGAWEGVIQIRARDGSFRWLDTAISRLAGQDGQYLVIHTDVTAQRLLQAHELSRANGANGASAALDANGQTQVEEALREKTAVLEASLESSIDGIIMTDLLGKRLLTNQRLTEILKIPPDLVADPPSQLPHLASLSTDPQGLLDKVYWLYEHPELSSREEIPFADGRTIDRISTPVRSPDGRNYGRIWVFRDITQSKQALERVERLAHYDTLTGLPNRHALRQQLTRLLTRPGGRLAMLYIDADGFKLINDTKGHGTGDELLVRMADRLRAAVSSPDIYLAHAGGDEFVYVLPEAGASQAMAFAQSILHTLTEPYLLPGDRRFVIGASIGVALAPIHGATVDALRSRVDIALHDAKANSKGSARLFEFSMEDRIQGHVQLEADLRAALETGEDLFVFYQPIVEIESGKITAREALARWHHPVRGWVSPAEFIPVAEASNLIDKLGALVLNRACRDAATWVDGARIAVNISTMQLGKGQLAAALRSALAATGLAPGRLEIEVTETALIGDEGKTIAELHQVHEIGARVALDDFGTGYSSLSHLRAFAFDKIKIDRSFVRDVAQRPDCAAVVRAVCALGRELRVTTVAEGVETAEQLEHVRAAGCREIQGYLYGRPTPSEQDAPRVAALK